MDGFKTKFIKEMNSFSQNLIGFNKSLKAGEEYAEKVIPTYKIKNSESIRYAPGSKVIEIITSYEFAIRISNSP